MTRSAKRKSARRRKSSDPYRDQKWVVVKAKTGRLRPGIIKRFVTIDGDIAFVHPREGVVKADMVPATHVFDSEEKANAFFTAEGELQWVVTMPDDDDGDDMPEIYEARVRSYVTKRHYDRWAREVQVIARTDGKPVSHRWGTRGFKTEREALRYALSKVADGIKEADAKISRFQDRKASFLKIQKRIKQLGIQRGMKGD